MTITASAGYRSTESKYKGGAHEMYVTYDLEEKTRAGTAVYPKVKRVYIAGDVKGWRAGDFRKMTGREVYGVRVEYEQDRRGYRRESFGAHRDRNAYRVAPTSVRPSIRRFVQIVELPERARDAHFYQGPSTKLPAKYREALQRVR